MQPVPPIHLSDQQIEEFVGLTNLTQIKKTVSAFAAETLTRIYQKLSAQGTKKSSALAFAGIEALEETSLLEAAGKGLSAPFFLELFSLDSRKRKKTLQDKLLPILVGLPQETFRQSLHDAAADHLRFFKQEGVAEPMQHHLLLLAHEIEKENRHFLERFSRLQKEIEGMNSEAMTYEQLASIREKIHNLTLYYEDTIDLLDRALAVAWNTNRPDLIDTLTSAKEAAHRQNWLGVGENADINFAPYSLQAVLKRRLETIFGNPDNPKEQEALHDSDPAIEGLAKFSLWYLSDYASIGLLPPLAQEEHELATPLREQYLTLAQENLAKQGLRTVRDLKDAEIFSKKMLIDYLQNRESVTLNS